jgi:hypothetical protein
MFLALVTAVVVPVAGQKFSDSQIKDQFPRNCRQHPAGKVKSSARTAFIR